MSFVTARLQRSFEEVNQALHSVKVDVGREEDEAQDSGETTGGNENERATAAAATAAAAAAASVIRSVHREIQNQSSDMTATRCNTAISAIAALDPSALPPITGLLLSDTAMRLAIILQGRAMKEIAKAVREIEEHTAYFDEITSSWVARTFYLVQSAPGRIGRLFLAISGGGAAASARDRLRRARTFLFRPNFLISIMFPHVHSADVASRRRDGLGAMNVGIEAEEPRLLTGSAILALTQGPFALVQREARIRSSRLQEIVSQRARAVGLLASLNVFKDLPVGVEDINRATLNLLDRVHSALLDERSSQIDGASHRDVLTSLEEATRALDSFEEEHVRIKDTYGKPSMTVRYWPLIIGGLIFGRGLYRYADARSTELAQFLRNLGATVDGFWKGWIVEPVKGILQTIRHDSDSLSIIGKESLRSDLESLERMTEEFGREVLKMSPQDASIAAKRVREGDLTSVLRVYENELKSPLKSAMLGSLVRTLLIQVQKTKVDVELAMNGIDKLLKSQELTFGFIGVAPSLIIVMLLSTSLLNYVRSSPSKGGKKGQRQASLHDIWKVGHRVASEDSSSARDMDKDDLSAYGSFLLELDQLYQHLRPLLKHDKHLCQALETDIRTLGSPDLDNPGRLRGVSRLRAFWLPVVISAV